MNEEQGKKAWELHNKIRENETMRRLLFLDNMSVIHELHNSGLYKTILGDENAPWSAYLGQHEVFYTASKVYTMNKIYEVFITKLAITKEIIAEIPTTKLSNLVPIVTKENVDEWLVKAKELTTHDFNDELRKFHGKISYLDCSHQNTKLYTICSSCGFRHEGKHVTVTQ